MKALYKILLSCVLCLNTAGFTAVHAEGEDIPQEPVPAETAAETEGNTVETAPAEGTEVQPEETQAAADTAEGETVAEGTEVNPEETPAATEPESGEVTPAEPEETVTPEETTVPEETVTPEETAAPEETPVPEETVTPEETAEPAEETTVPEVKEDEPAETAASETETAESDTEAEEAELSEETEELEEVEEEVNEVEEELEEPEEILEASGYKFNISNNEATITGYTGSSKVISIPNTVQSGSRTYEVTSIDTDDFKNYNMTELILPENLREINDCAFSNLWNLKKVTINSRSLNDCDSGSASDYWTESCSIFYNSGVESGVEVVFGSKVSRVPAYLFATGKAESENRHFLLTKVAIPASVKEIGISAFENCYALKTASIKGAGVIKQRAFFNTSLSSVSLPSNTTEIGNEAFENTNVTSVTLPKGLTDIGENAFANCKKLTKVTINSRALNDCDSGSADDYWNERYSAFYNSGASKGVEVVFGSEVSRIPAYIFATGEAEPNKRYFRVTKVTIPASVKEIGKDAFYNCYMLKTASIKGAGVIEDAAFYNTALTSVNLPANTTKIGREAFENTNVTSITLPKGLTNLGENAFANCRKLTKVTINSRSLNDCNSGAASDYWSDSDSVFYNSGVNKGVEVVFGSGVSRIPAYIFATGEDEPKEHYFRITKVTIPTSVKEIGRYAFYNCFKLKTVKYNGASTKFNKLVINDYNEPLLNANEYYTYYHLVFVRRNGKDYWYENNKRQAVKGDPKNIIDARFHTERGREIFDPNSKAWYWLDSVYGGAKATGKEVWMPYVYQDEKSWSYEDKVRVANDSDSGMESYVLNAMLNGDGKWVRYDGNGKMLKGWVTIEDDLAKIYPTQKGNTYYYDNQTGMMARGYVKIGWRTYHFDEVSGKRLD